MGARYPYYLLADSRDGQQKDAEVTRTTPSSQPVHNNVRHGFVYERVPHITLKSIANNAEIDVIWDKWQAKLELLRESLKTALKKSWQEWEIPREAEAKPGPHLSRNCMPTGGRPALPGRRRLTPRSPPRPSSNTFMTSPTTTRRRFAWLGHSPSRASRPIALLGWMKTTS